MVLKIIFPSSGTSPLERGTLPMEASLLERGTHLMEASPLGWILLPMGLSHRG